MRGGGGGVRDSGIERDLHATVTKVSHHVSCPWSARERLRVTAYPHAQIKRDKKDKEKEGMKREKKKKKNQEGRWKKATRKEDKDAYKARKQAIKKETK